MHFALERYPGRRPGQQDAQCYPEAVYAFRWQTFNPYALEAFERSCADDLVLVTGAERQLCAEGDSACPWPYWLRSIVTEEKRYHSVYEGLKSITEL